MRQDRLPSSCFGGVRRLLRCGTHICNMVQFTILKTALAWRSGNLFVMVQQVASTIDTPDDRVPVSLLCKPPLGHQHRKGGYDARRTSAKPPQILHHEVHQSRVQEYGAVTTDWNGREMLFVVKFAVHGELMWSTRLSMGSCAKRHESVVTTKACG